MKLLSIGEVARRTGLRPSALRYYEDEGILPPARRVNGRRQYDSDSIRMVEVLRFAQQAGFSLSEIKALFRGFDRGATLSVRWRSLAEAKLEELDALVANAKRMRRAIELGLQCGCVRLEDCTLPRPDRAPTAAPRGRRAKRSARR